MKPMFFLLLVGLMLPLAQDARAVPGGLPDSTTVFETGLASQYTAWFHGRRTTNGETYDHRGFTAAHRTLPFGSFLRVVHKETGTEVVVRINDRGPFVRSRVLELSGEAARALGMEEGIPASVAIYLLDEKEGQQAMAAYTTRRSTPPVRPATPSPLPDTPTPARTDASSKPAPSTVQPPPASTNASAARPASPPAARPAPPLTPAEQYAVQLASLRDPKAAQDLVQAVAGAWSQTVQVEGQTWHRVYVGRYQDIEQARQKQALLAQEGRSGFVKRLETPPSTAGATASTQRRW